jgi:hypothetical protein
MSTNGGAQGFPRSIDAALGVLMRVLLAAMCALGGAWLTQEIPLLGGRPILGAVVGLALVCVALVKEKAIAGFCTRHRVGLALAGFLLYVVILGLATYSELFNLGWFDWLSI